MNLDLKSIDRDLQGNEPVRATLAPPKDTPSVISPEDDIAIANSINQVHKELNKENKNSGIIVFVVILAIVIYLLDKNKFIVLPWKI